MLENINWLGHDSFRIADTKQGRYIYIDPFQLASHEPKADLVLISHDHFDHYSPDDLYPLLKPDTVIVTVASVAKQIAAQRPAQPVITVKPGDHVDALGYPVEAVAAYNTNTFREPGQPFHPKSAGFVGFIITVDGVRYYHTGDTDVIPEMSSIQADVALIPVSGTYVMTPEEAIAAASRIKARVLVPMHYGAIVGSEMDAKQFADGVKQKGLDAEILQKAA